MKRIFIGGTGRSGTTILQHVLSFHEQLYTVPIETKFIVQTDGFYSLVKNLTDDYSVTDSTIALARFKTLMYDVITHTGNNPYEDLAGQPYGRLEFTPQELFPNYREKLDVFFAHISDKYYPRAQLVQMCATLVDSFFAENAISRNADAWVEKTPSNLFRIEFLFEMFPDALFINCIRDPRGVLDSFMRKEWLPGTLEDGANYLTSYYQYIAQKRQFGQSKQGQYYEIRLEDIVADPVEEMKKLLTFMQVSPFSPEKNEFVARIFREGGIRWSEEQNKFCDSWERDFSAEEKQTVTAILADVIADYGYD